MVEAGDGVKIIVNAEGIALSVNGLRRGELTQAEVVRTRSLAMEGYSDSYWRCA